jgi:hypothetical protein
VNAKVAPFPKGLFSAHILPPCASMIFFDRNRPWPVPMKDFVANFENSLGIISGFIPVPVSVMDTITLSSSLLRYEITILASCVNCGFLCKLWPLHMKTQLLFINGVPYLVFSK